MWFLLKGNILFAHSFTTIQYFICNKMFHHRTFLSQPSHKSNEWIKCCIFAFLERTWIDWRRLALQLVELIQTMNEHIFMWFFFHSGKQAFATNVYRRISDKIHVNCSPDFISTTNSFHLLISIWISFGFYVNVGFFSLSVFSVNKTYLSINK